MRLDLTSLNIVSRKAIDYRHGVQHFATLLDSCFDYAFGRIQNVTVHCALLEPGSYTTRITEKFSAIPRLFRLDMPQVVDLFLYFNPETTLRIVLPEFGRTSAATTRLEIAYWIAAVLRPHTSHVPRPADTNMTPYVPVRGMSRWNLPNVKFLAPIQDEWDNEADVFLTALRYEQQTKDFWMVELEKWYDRDSEDNTASCRRFAGSASGAQGRGLLRTLESFPSVKDSLYYEELEGKKWEWRSAILRRASRRVVSNHPYHDYEREMIACSGVCPFFVSHTGTSTLWKIHSCLIETEVFS